jgi:uncharacterized membrane protein YqgA involved in biofilm formation
MLGVYLNVIGILVGSTLALMGPKNLSVNTQSRLKALIGLFTIYFGLKLVWLSINGSFSQTAKQLGILLLSMSLGNVTGKLLRLHIPGRKIGAEAREIMHLLAENPQNEIRKRGFHICTALFCVNPLGWTGAIQAGFTDFYGPLGVKAAIDGLACLGFVFLFGWPVILTIVPVFLVEGMLCLSAHQLEPWLHNHALLDSIGAVNGFLIFTVGILMLNVRKVEVVDYIPSLAIAPLLTYFWR